MGVPQLFRHLARACPGAVRTLADAQRQQQQQQRCHELHVDFNSVVHTCARAVEEEDGDRGSTEEHETRVIEACLRHLETLTAKIAPLDRVFVAVDGAPPRAKMHQQRQRRFVAVHRTDAVGRWDTNAVTPGTAFMERLGAALKERALSPLMPGGPRLEVSGADEPGEGEQKIFARIRANGNGNGRRHWVYGLDADLLLMAMSSPAPACVAIVREQELGGPLQVVEAADLARYAAAEVLRACGPGAAAAAMPAEADRVLEFVAACALLGNDFVPALPGLRIRDGGVQAVLRALGRALCSPRMQAGRRLAVGGPDALGGLDPGVLSAVAEALAKDESGALCDLERRHAERAASADAAKARGGRRGGAQRHPDHELREQPQQRPLSMMLEDDHPMRMRQPPSVSRGGEPGWRARYYRTLFGGACSPDDVHGACLAYAAGVAWSVAYIARGRCLSWGWHYPHAHAPTALDLHHATTVGDVRSVGQGAAAAFDAADEAHAAGERALGSREAWQLLLVLPPQSAALQPSEAARAAVADAGLGCAHMFPHRFEVCCYLREKLHECPALLPEPDAKLLIRSLSRCKK